MSFKTHLLVVSFIIATVYGVWQLLYVHPQPAIVEVPQPQAGDKSIQIIRASWGLNCANMRFAQNGAPESPATFANSSPTVPQIKENNVLEAVSRLCNGQPACSIAPTVEILGTDPQPQCFDKKLEIEYRCFAFDRPWRVRGNNTTLQIDCSKTH